MPEVCKESNKLQSWPTVALSRGDEMWILYFLNLNSASGQGCPSHPSPAPYGNSTSAEIWKVLRYAKSITLLQIALQQSHTLRAVISALLSGMRSIPLCRTHHGWRMMRCKRKKQPRILQPSPVWPSYHSISVSEFSPGKGTPWLILAQLLVDEYYWLRYEQVVI